METPGNDGDGGLTESGFKPPMGLRPFCYLAFSVPAIVGDIAADSYGLGYTTTGYTLFVLLMVVLAAAALPDAHATRDSN